MTSFDFLSGFNNIDPKFILDAIDLMQTVEASDAEKEIMNMEKYSLQGTTQGRYLTGGVPPIRFSM